jgi:hypothetical protein
MPNPAPGDLAAAVDAVLSSQTFERTHRLLLLLKYLRDSTLAGDAGALKESVIGQRVFGRPADYCAADDNIVRSSIRQLRMKLEEYYAAEGARAVWRVTVPKGSYSLHLEPAPDSGRPHWRRAVPAALALLVVVAALMWLVRSVGPRTRDCLLALLDPGPGQRLLIVGSDPNVQLYQNITGRRVELADYLDRQFMRKLPAGQPVRFYGGSATETFFAAMIPDFVRAVPSSALTVMAADRLTPKDFERDNAVLISGPVGNPWVQMFDQKLNFQVELLQVDRPACIVNRQPRRGESATYVNYVDASKTVVCYARMAYVPGLRPGTHVLLAGGPHHASTLAAAHFLTSPAGMQSLRRQLGRHRWEGLPWFEAVVEARAFGDEPAAMRIAAIRELTQVTAPSAP